ncbi:hypothetical protein F5050DRAFT_1809659 [Lentinula boryana]|uniref:Uncharacterized protein n=1 Tax=Lentinula boryana TaxID=40481 RepID=A0ABQ8Q762_9AGAR|nr:hypothetical protein F5050DRAFT_1809659 [Lentinula boryana]
MTALVSSAHQAETVTEALLMSTSSSSSSAAHIIHGNLLLLHVVALVASINGWAISVY